MTDLQTVLQAHHQAIEDFLTAARAVPPTQWSQPRAPGKWSPGQVAEHLALAYQVNRGVLHGGASPVTAPRWLRPIIRKFLLGNVLRRNRFIPGIESPKAFRPSSAPAAPVQLLGRLAGRWRRSRRMPGPWGPRLLTIRSSAASRWAISCAYRRSIRGIIAGS